MQVSLIATVLNEGESIRRLLDSIVEQSRHPDEIIICDGGSIDNTIDIIYEYADRLPIDVIVWDGANISQGRNAAIEAANFPVVAATDAGVVLHPDWLAWLISPFEENENIYVSAGFFLPDAMTPFEVAMGATVLPSVGDIDPETFMPSSRSVAFRKEAWAAVGGYPEWLDFCEDLIFDFRLHALRGPFAFVSNAIAYFQPRSNLKAYWKQYYQYARGDGKANLFFRRHLIRYMTYLVALPFILAAWILVSPWWLLGLSVGAVYYLWTPYRRLTTQWHHLSLPQKLESICWVPVIRIVGDLAKMKGYPEGVLWRIKNRPPDWRIDSQQTREIAR